MQAQLILLNCHLLQACRQPSGSTIGYRFNAARFEPELLSRDGVISAIALLMTYVLVLHLDEKIMPK